jgi:hypothetical protein
MTNDWYLDEQWGGACQRIFGTEVERLTTRRRGAQRWSRQGLPPTSQHKEYIKAIHLLRATCLSVPKECCPISRR